MSISCERYMSFINLPCGMGVVFWLRIETLGIAILALTALLIVSSQPVPDTYEKRGKY